MGIFGLLLVLHMVVVAAFVAGRALHAKLGPVAAAETAMGPALSLGHPSPMPTGRSLDEYVQAGLMDLRIMLVQAARRRHD